MQVFVFSQFDIRPLILTGFALVVLFRWASRHFFSFFWYFQSIMFLLYISTKKKNILLLLCMSLKRKPQHWKPQSVRKRSFVTWCELCTWLTLQSSTMEGAFLLRMICKFTLIFMSLCHLTILLWVKNVFFNSQQLAALKRKCITWAK